MKKRLLALLLVLALGLSLAACSAPAAEDSEQPSETPTDSAAPSETIAADLSQDILTFAAGDLAKEDALLIVNGEAVPTSLFLYWLAFSCSYFESTYYYYGFTVADFASMILSDSCTMAAYYAILEQKVMEYGCALTDEQMEAINTDMGVGTEDHEQRKVLYGLTEDDLMFIYSVSDYYDNLMAALIPTPTEEELNSYVYQTKHILICTATDSTDGVVTLSTGETVEFDGTVEEYNAAALDKANGIVAQLNAAGSQEELEALFDQLMSEHSQDGRDENGDLYSPEGYTTTIGQMVAEFEEAALALEFGQFSEPVESTYGYHIILRGEVAEISEYTESYRTAEMDALISEWLAETELEESELLAELDVADFYERYVAWQSACVAQLNTEEK